jgi:hypothetical protein
MTLTVTEMNCWSWEHLTTGLSSSRRKDDSVRRAAFSVVQLKSYVRRFCSLGGEMLTSCTPLSWSCRTPRAKATTSVPTVGAALTSGAKGGAQAAEEGERYSGALGEALLPPW